MTELSTATPAPAKASGADVSRFIELMQRATPEQKAMIRESIGAGGIKKRKQRHGTNADAKQYVNRFGEAQHPAEFRVLPPQTIYDKGPAAVAAWFEKREQGLSITEAELDDIVAAATL